MDLVFWKWQELHNSQEKIDIIDGYPGAVSDKTQAIPNFMQGMGQSYSIDTPLYPFIKDEKKFTYLTSNDMVNIKDLGY